MCGASEQFAGSPHGSNKSPSGHSVSSQCPGLQWDKPSARCECRARSKQFTANICTRRSAGRKQEEKARADVWVRAAPETWTEGGREKSDGRTREVFSWLPSQDVVRFYRRDFDFLGEPRESISLRHKGNSPSIQNSVLSVARHGLHEAAPAGFGARNRSGQLGPCRCPGYGGMIRTRRASGPCYC